jgi:hypothetical protein
MKAWLRGFALRLLKWGSVPVWGRSLEEELEKIISDGKAGLPATSAKTPAQKEPGDFPRISKKAVPGNALVLRLFHTCHDVLVFDPERVSHEVAPASSLGLDSTGFSGSASLREGGFSALYKHGGALWVAFGSHKYRVSDNLTSEWTMEPWRRLQPKSFFRSSNIASSARQFALTEGGVPVQVRRYDVMDDFDTRPFTFWGEDLEDFLLWVHEMLRSPEKLDWALSSWK